MAKSQVKSNEEDLKRFEKDRLEINAAYDKGFLSESINENNENTSKNQNEIDLKGRIDRYGFIHNQKLPDDLTENELKRNKIEKLREIKWRSMFKEWQKHYLPYKFKASDKLIGRVFKGIPDSMRNLAWLKLLDVESQIKEQTGIYEKMKNLARQYSNELRQIDLDINRTFRNNDAYKKRYCQRQKQLYNILAAYSIYNTEIGYCQGMSTLTALILMYLADEEKTFWALSQLMSNTKYSMHGFFISGFPKLLRYSDKHEMVIKALLPKIHKKFIKCNITPLIYTTKWFLQCFLDALPFSLVLRVWDVYLLKGDIAILAMSYCILKMHKRTLLQKNFDMDKINEFLNHKLPENFMYDDDEVIEKLEICIEKLLAKKFEQGSIIEPIPNVELPKIPFGNFKKIESRKEAVTSEPPPILEIKAVSNKDRDAFVEQMARDRLASEKKKSEELRQKKRAEKLLTLSNGGIENIIDGGKPIKNISDEEDDEDEDDDIVESDDDDLNPSKLSEYDDEKVEKESVISNVTHQSSSHLSLANYSSLEKKSNQNDGSSSRHFVNKKVTDLKNTHSNESETSDYENLNSTENTSIKKETDKKSIGTPSSKRYNSSSLEFKPKTTQIESSSTSTSTTKNIEANAKETEHMIPSVSTSALSTGVYTKNQLPTSHSYIVNTTSIATQTNSSSENSTQHMPASIKSNPPPISPSTFLAFSPDQSLTKVKNGVSTRSHLNYHLSNSNTNNNNALILNVKNTLNKTNDYTRSPHGIYTRVNVPPTNVNNNNSNNSTTNGSNLVFSQRSPTTFRLIRSPVTTLKTPIQIPQSSSTVMISSGASNVGSNGVMSKPTSPTIGNSHTNVSNPLPSQTKRTASLRSIQKQSQLSPPLKQNQLDLLNGTNGYNSISSSSFIQTNNTPTKQQLQNHSLRIASIQQSQQQKQQSVTTNGHTGASFYSSVISQNSKQNQERINQLNQQINSIEIKNFSNQRSQGMPVQATKPTKLIQKATPGTEIIEQYDYI